MSRDDLVPQKLVEAQAEQWRREARDLERGNEGAQDLERRLRKTNARCLRACADRLIETIRNGKVARGLC